MAEKAVVVIDVQKCFLPGGSLATGNTRNATMGGSAALGASITKFINTENPEHLFISKDWHPEGHTSFLTEEEKAKGMMTFPNAAGKQEFAKGIASGRYEGRNASRLNTRKWGQPETRLNQKLWPEHCVQGTDGAELDPAFETTLSVEQKAKAVTILKGDDPTIDSYSAIADALGNPTPHTDDGTKFLDILKGSNIKEIYLTGIARDVCVFWTALDMLNYWIFPKLNSAMNSANQTPVVDNTVKLIFMYDLTRPVFSGGAPYTDITPEQITAEVNSLASKFNIPNNMIPSVFEIREGGYEAVAVGGSRRLKAVCNKRHAHTKKCKRGGSKPCGRRGHRHTKRCRRNA